VVGGGKQRKTYTSDRLNNKRIVIRQYGILPILIWSRPEFRGKNHPPEKGFVRHIANGSFFVQTYSAFFMNLVFFVGKRGSRREAALRLNTYGLLDTATQWPHMACSVKKACTKKYYL